MTGFTAARPPFYRETFPQQGARLAFELKQAQEKHTLNVVKSVSEWFEVRRILGDVYTESDCLVEASVQCKIEGVCPEHLSAAVTLVTDIYMGR